MDGNEIRTRMRSSRMRTVHCSGCLGGGEGGCLPRGCLPRRRGVSAYRGVHLPLCGQTDSCENGCSDWIWDQTKVDSSNFLIATCATVMVISVRDLCLLFGSSKQHVFKKRIQPLSRMKYILRTDSYFNKLVLWKSRKYKVLSVRSAKSGRIAYCENLDGFSNFAWAYSATVIIESCFLFMSVNKNTTPYQSKVYLYEDTSCFQFNLRSYPECTF